MEVTALRGMNQGSLAAWPLAHPFAEGRCYHQPSSQPPPALFGSHIFHQVFTPFLFSLGPRVQSRHPESSGSPAALVFEGISTLVADTQFVPV